MKRLALILLALLLLAPAAGAAEVWEKQLGSEITAIVTDETGAIIIVGTETGNVYRYEADGTQVGSPISFETCPVTNLVLTQDGSQLAVQYQETGTSAVYLVNTGTWAEWFNITDPGYQYGVAARSDGSVWYILAHESTDTGLDYLAVITPERGAWFTVPDLLPGTFIVSGDGSWAAGAEGTVQTTADLIPLSGLPPLSELPALSGLLSPSDLPLLSDYYTAGASSGGIVTLDDGRVKIYHPGPGYWGAYAATNTKFSNTTPLTIQFDYSKPAGYNAQFTKVLRLYAVTDSANATRSTANYFHQSPTSDQALLWTNDVTSAAMTEVTLWLDGTGNISTDGSNWTAIDGWSNVGDTFNLELHNADYGNYPGWFGNLTVDALTFYPEIQPTTLSPSATQAYSGTITHITRTEVGTRFAVSTASNLYLQQITESAFGDTVTLGPRVGTPYALTLAHEGAFIVEGRNNLIDIFRTDGAQVGIYTAGGPVRHVDVAQANGLYAAGGSDDGKYYVFSKAVSSSWYLLHASDSASPVTALAMSWRGEIVLIGRSNGRLVAFQPAVEEDEFPGAIRLTVYKDALPYVGAQLTIEHGGTDQAWGEPTTTQTDDYGVASVPVQWGEYVRVTVGDGELQRVILPASSQTDYVLRIKGPDPLRTGAQYSSGYDPDTQRIYLHYDDTREKTHLVQYEIIRSVDNAVVFQREYSTLPVNDYYQIPAGWTNSSYRIQLTASGSPSFTNTWSQWVGADGVASLPADLDTYARMGIAFFLILFVAGLFSYLSGPQGAVVVSMFAGALVLWGWLPLPPTVVALCIVWAFLGLLGRTSGE